MSNKRKRLNAKTSTVVLAMFLYMALFLVGVSLAEDEKTVLYIYGVDESYNLYLTEKHDRDFIEDNPNIELRFVNISQRDTWEFMSDISTYSLAQPDIILLNNASVDLFELCRKGLVVPISSEKLKAQVNKMYSFVGNYLNYNDQLMGYPACMFSTWTSVNKELLSQYDLGEPAEDVSEWVAQLEKYLSRISEETGGKSGYLTYLECRDVINRIIMLQIQDSRASGFYSELPDLCNPEMVSLIERVTALVGGYWDEFKGAASELYDIWAEDPITYAFNNETRDFIKPFTMEKDMPPTYEAEFYYYVINPHSEHKEIAEKYLEYMDESRLSTVELYDFYPITAEKGNEYGAKAIPQETIDFYGEAAWNIRISHYMPLMLKMRIEPTCSLLMRQLLHGEITAEQYLTHLQERMEEMISLTK